jgi:AbrB family looped-hinge helix DNA binding protein
MVRAWWRPRLWWFRNAPDLAVLEDYMEVSPMEHIETTRMSSKGQVVIPEAVRNRLGLKAGAQFVVMGGRDVVILKAIAAPARDEFAAMAAKVRRQARQAGLCVSDVAQTVRKVRGAR